MSPTLRHLAVFLFFISRVVSPELAQAFSTPSPTRTLVNTEVFNHQALQERLMLIGRVITPLPRAVRTQRRAIAALITLKVARRNQVRALRAHTEELLSAIENGRLADVTWAQSSGAFLDRLARSSPLGDDRVVELMREHVRLIATPEKPVPHLMLHALTLALLNRSTSRSDLDGLSAFILRYNALIKTGKITRHRGLFSVEQLLLNSISPAIEADTSEQIRRSEEVYLDQSERLLQLPDPYFDETLILNGVHSGIHNSRGLDVDDLRASLSLFQKLIQAARLQIASRGAVSPELRLSLTRLLFSFKKLYSGDTTHYPPGELAALQQTLTDNRTFVCDLLSAQINVESGRSGFSPFGLQWDFGTLFWDYSGDALGTRIRQDEFLLHSEDYPDEGALILNKLKGSSFIQYDPDYLDQMADLLKTLKDESKTFFDNTRRPGRIRGWRALARSGWNHLVRSAARSPAPWNERPHFFEVVNGHHRLAAILHIAQSRRLGAVKWHDRVGGRGETVADIYTMYQEDRLRSDQRSIDTDFSEALVSLIREFGFITTFQEAVANGLASRLNAMPMGSYHRAHQWEFGYITLVEKFTSVSPPALTAVSGVSDFIEKAKRWTGARSSDSHRFTKIAA